MDIAKKIDQTITKSIPFTFSQNVLYVGLGTFLMNASISMTIGVMALMMKKKFGVSIAWIGFFEGVVSSISLLLKPACGLLSDYLKDRKTFLIFSFIAFSIGYPLMALAATPFMFFLGIALNRLAHGLKGTPRDAIVVDLSHQRHVGRSYGVRHSLGAAGALLGTFVAFYFFQQNVNDQTIFWIAFGFSAIAIIPIFFVNIPETNYEIIRNNEKISLNIFKHFDRHFWYVVFTGVLIIMARTNEPLLFLDGNQRFGLDQSQTPIIAMLYSLGPTFLCYATGWLADRMPRYKVLVLALVILFISQFVLSMANSVSVFYIGIAIWGIQFGMTSALVQMLVADTAPTHLRGTAFSIFYIASAIGVFLNGTVNGYMLQQYGGHIMFLLDTCIAFLALFIFVKFSIGKKIYEKVIYDKI